MQEIPLGTLNSKLYERNGETYYTITPIFGTSTNFYLNAPLSKIEVLKNEDNELLIKKGILKLRMSFKPYTPGLFKLKLKPYYFGIPFGIYWCEISATNKTKLQDVFVVYS
ncbi:hypothetical protein R50072_28160 [Simiduia litorea]